MRYVWCVFFAVSFVHAGDDFTWAPITDADWAVKPDSNGGMDAVMIFEKVIADDRNFKKGKFYLEVYRRIKVFTPQGRSWAEVSIPFVRKKDEIEELMARTVLPGGKEIPLQEDQIHESEPLRTEDVRVLQKSFSLQGVTDGSILEYRYFQRSSSFHNDWVAQKDIPLIRGEFTWRFIDRVDNPYTIFAYRMLEIKPNYIWLNSDKPGTVELLPSKDDPEEILFTIENLPAFRAEPLALPDDAVKTQLLCYYGRSGDSMEYWLKVSQGMKDQVDEFIDDRDEIKEIVDQLEPSTVQSKKIESAYAWVVRNIRNVNTFTGDDEPESNRNLSDVIERRYGTTEEINILFHAMIREMNLDTRMIYMMDHRGGRFVQEAKFWQFDCSGVHVTGDGGVPMFFAPGYRFMPPGLVPWYTEGTQALFIGHPFTRFVVLPPSVAQTNRVERTFTLTVDGDLGMQGRVEETFSGHAARSMWLSLSQVEETARDEMVRKDLKELCSLGEVDSAMVVSVDTLHAQCSLAGSVTIPAIEKLSPRKALLHPYSIITSENNPFSAEKRKYPIVMEYAFSRNERISFTLPPSWIVESLPKSPSFENKIGKITCNISTVGSTVTFDRTLTLNQAFWPELMYKDVKALFAAFERMEEISAVLVAK